MFSAALMSAWLVWPHSGFPQTNRGPSRLVAAVCPQAAQRRDVFLAGTAQTLRPASSALTQIQWCSRPIAASASLRPAAALAATLVPGASTVPGGGGHRVGQL